MNNWPNPDALGEPKFPDIARPHFLSYVADASMYGGIPGYVKQDTLLVGLWNPESRQWLLMTGNTTTAREIALECGYISPCYTEEEMRQAKIDTFEWCAGLCESIGDNALSDCESNAAFYCASRINSKKDKT